MANVGSQKGSITTDPTDIKGMIRKYHEQNHAHKFYSSDKMDRFFLSHNLKKKKKRKSTQKPSITGLL